MDNTIEAQILSLVDEFIDMLIEMQDSGAPSEKKLHDDAVEKLLALADKAVILLGGREEYLEAMLNQIIMQKLPPGAILESFEGFKEQLEEIISETVDLYRQRKSFVLEEAVDTNLNASENFIDTSGTVEPDTSVAEDQNTIPAHSDSQGIEAREEPAAERGEQKSSAEEPVEESTEENSLKALVNMMFPGMDVETEYEIANTVCDYYIPEYRLAICACRSEKSRFSPLLEFILKKLDITAVLIDFSIEYNAKALKREIMRIISQKDKTEKRIFDLSAEY